jgi:HD-like signal output (HDOD) protein/CheY-like chemotaxis protein
MKSALKTRVLFVDDEPTILELLDLTVAGMSGAWETGLAESGEKALKLLEKDRFDVVVADMRMPGMNGAQLLNEVMRRHPTTSRIILSGYADQQELLRCIGATHQFLAKPCEVTVLQATLTRMRDLRDRLRGEEIQKLVIRKNAIPTIPEVYFKIAEALQKPDCPVELIAEAVAKDPGLTARILQLVNSAFFGYAREVSSAEEAVMLLGVGRIRSLALTAHLFTTFEAVVSEHWSVEQIWGHSIRTAQWAKKIAEIESDDDHAAEQAFTSGILHDAGKLLLMNNLLGDYLDILKLAAESHRPLAEVELEKLGTTHATVGAYLLDLWGLPMSLVEAVALHHEPTRASQMVFSPLTAVHAANVFENAAHPQGDPQAAPQLDALYLDQLSLGSRVEAWRGAN